MIKINYFEVYDYLRAILGLKNFYSLNKWELEIITDEQEMNTEPFTFINRTAIPIAATCANTIESIITVLYVP